MNPEPRLPHVRGGMSIPESPRKLILGNGLYNSSPVVESAERKHTGT